MQTGILGMVVRRTGNSLYPFKPLNRHFASEPTAYHLLKTHDLITGPAYIVIKAANQFHTRTTRPNEM